MLVYNIFIQRQMQKMYLPDADQQDLPFNVTFDFQPSQQSMRQQKNKAQSNKKVIILLFILLAPLLVFGFFKVALSHTKSILEPPIIKGQSNISSKQLLNDEKNIPQNKGQTPQMQKSATINQQQITEQIQQIIDDEQNLQPQALVIQQEQIKTNNDYPMDPTKKPFQSKKDTNLLKEAQISQQSYKRAVEYIHLGVNQPTDSMIQQEKKYLEAKYSINQVKVELPFCVVVHSNNNYNNQRFKFNLKSIINQQYSNYRIIYIDDASTDHTAQHVQEYLKNQKFPKEKYTIIQNGNKKGSLQNQRIVAKQLCQPHEIYFMVQGGDGLVGKQVFKLYNVIYQKSKAQFVYANSIKVTDGSIGLSKQLNSQSLNKGIFRKQTDLPIDNLKSFYTGLFMKVPIQSLEYPKSSKYFQTYKDRAMIYPMLELLRDSSKIIYLPEILYIENDQTQNSIKQVDMGEKMATLATIQSITPQNKLQCLFRDEDNVCMKPIQYVTEKSKQQK